MNKREILELLSALLNDTGIATNLDNMELFDEDPDIVVDHDHLLINIKTELTRLSQEEI